MSWRASAPRAEAIPRFGHCREWFLGTSVLGLCFSRQEQDPHTGSATRTLRNDCGTKAAPAAASPLPECH